LHLFKMMNNVFNRKKLFLKNVYNLLEISSLNNRRIATDKIESKSNLYISLCIERHPVISRAMTKLENKVFSVHQKLQFTNSLKSNYELQQEIDEKKLKSHSKNYDDNFDIFFKNSIKDLEEWNQKESNKLQNLLSTSELQQSTASSIDKNLDKSLFFLTKQRTVTGEEIWLFPKEIVAEGETLKQAAKRIFNNCCGPNVNGFLYGAAPLGVTESPNYDENQKEMKSSKTYYFLARYLDGPITCESEHQWLNPEELKKYLPKKDYKNIIHFFLTSK